MGTHSHSVWIDAAPDQVWGFFTDLDRIPQWQTGKPEVHEATGRGDVAGTTYAVRRGPAIAHTTILECVRPYRYRSRTDAYLGMWFELVTYLVPEGDGTRVDLKAETHWPIGMRHIGRLIEAVVLSGHEAHSELNQLKLLVEGGPR